MKKSKDDVNIKPILAVGVEFIQKSDDEYIFFDHLHQIKIVINLTTYWILNSFKGEKTLIEIGKEMAREFEIDDDIGVQDVVNTFNYFKRLKVIGEKKLYFTIKQKYLSFLGVIWREKNWL